VVGRDNQKRKRNVGEKGVESGKGVVPVEDVVQFFIQRLPPTHNVVVLSNLREVRGKPVPNDFSPSGRKVGQLVLWELRDIRQMAGQFRRAWEEGGPRVPGCTRIAPTQ